MSKSYRIGPRQINLEKTWRESGRISLVAGVVRDHLFIDTKPNYVIVTNYSDEVIFIDVSSVVGTERYLFTVEPRGRVQWIWGQGQDRVYLFCAADAVISVTSYEAPVMPSSVVQTLGGTVKIDQTANGVSVVGSLANYIMIANAVAITDTSLHTFDILTASGLTEDQIRQYKEFKISLFNSHNQGPTVSLRTSYKANAVYTSAANLYSETSSLPANGGKLLLAASTGGVGVSPSIKAIPSLKGLHSNLLVDITFSVAPISGSITIGVEMHA